MKDRRSFLKNIAGTGAAAMFPFYSSPDPQGLLWSGNDFVQALAAAEGKPNEDLSGEEDFWQMVRQAYSISPNIINLNNGGVSPQPKVVQEAVEHYSKMSNEAPSYYMWRVVDAGREPLRAKLASLAGCSAEELAIDRNSSEALETVIFGLRLKAGDEVVLTKQDYPNMINAWKQREHREGIVLKWLDLDLPFEDDEKVVAQFASAFTAKTKVVQVTHIINWTGQVLPVRAIADAAHQRGIEVLCDAAHTFAHLNYKIPDLGCDYLGTSLHKWLCAPFGSGLLWVRRDKISKLYPMFAAQNPESEDIRKFENLGTRSFAIEQAIGHAVDFHEMIGADRKQERLHFLKKYWTEKALEMPGVSIGTPLGQRHSCAIALLQVAGMKPEDVAERLFSEAKVHTVAINWENIHGVRITPNVYTLKKDLDVLLAALHHILKTR